MDNYFSTIFKNTLNLLVNGEKKHNFPLNPPTIAQLPIHVHESIESNKGMLFSKKITGGFVAL
jgi:hypothetical protein